MPTCETVFHQMPIFGDWIVQIPHDASFSCLVQNPTEGMGLLAYVVFHRKQAGVHPLRGVRLVATSLGETLHHQDGERVTCIGSWTFDGEARIGWIIEKKP